MDNLKSLVHSLLPSSPAFYLAFEAPSVSTKLTAIVLPIVFFLISKTVDVLVKIYFETKKTRRIN